MLTRSPWSQRASLGLAGVIMLGLAACTEEVGEVGRAVAEVVADESSSSGHLGRVHVILQPQPDELEPEPQLQISGRFVEYRGVSEDFARARTNLPVPAWEQLVPGQCVASERLLPSSSTAHTGDNRELSLIDAGDVRVSLADREYVTPLALVPDLLPWLSGVEYAHVDDRLPILPVDPDGTSPVLVSVDGSPDGSLEGFSTSVAVPAALELQTAKVTSSRLTIDWRPPGDTGHAVVLRLQAFTASAEPTGEEVTCLVADTGRANLALSPLVRAGLGAEAALLRVSASRFDLARITAGSFGPVEVVVELRAQKTLPLL